MPKPDASALSDLPAVHRVLEDPAVRDLPRELATACARDAVAAARDALREGAASPGADALCARVVADTAARVAAALAPRLRPVINATGVPIHTNLGRAPLHPEARDAVAAVAAGYCNVELDLAAGARGGRLAGVSGPLRRLCGGDGGRALDAVAVNNNAAAVLLVLTALARDREVVVSRGELVEIGGSFRVPEVIAAGGARLVEVGATNRTRADDYAAVVGPDTAMLLRVHPSNFRVEGFTERPSRTALVALGRERGVPVVEDLGSGLFGALPAAAADAARDWGEGEAVDEVLAAGVDLVCFSGDKLLGGPQAGIIAGRPELVAACRRHPLYRALRLDKLVLAALEATLRLYVAGRGDELPVRSMLGMDRDACRRAAEALAAELPGARVESDHGVTGGGALPARGLPTAVVALDHDAPDRLAHALRVGAPAVVARVARGALLLDPRTVLPGQAPDLVAAVRRALAAAPSSSSSTSPAPTPDDSPVGG